MSFESGTDECYMQRALELALQAEKCGEVPVGALLASEQGILAEGYNQPIQAHDPSAHAEIIAMRAAGQVLNNYRLIDTTLYVTLEPCGMCASALIHARVARVVFGASDPKTGAFGGAYDILSLNHHNHRPQIQGGILAKASVELLQGFFQSRR